jgi:hypothetical protein
MANSRWGPPGLHHVGAYQVSGVPWISGSLTMAQNQEHKYKFPYVTQNIQVINLSSRPIRVHFASKDGPDAGWDPIGGMHFIELDSDEDSLSLNVKCTKLYVSTANVSHSATGEYRVIATLTNIPSGSMADNALSGSGITDLDSS